MRVVQVNSYSNGSTGHIANTIHKTLLANGDESLFAYGNGPDISDGGYRIGNRINSFFHTCITLFAGLHGYSSVISTYRLVKKIKKFKPDIVHLHNLHGSYINIRVLFKYLKRHKVNTVVTLHDCWLYTGKCYHYYEAKCDKFLHKCGNCPQLSMYPKSYWFDFTSKMLKDKKKLIGTIENLYIVTVSKWLQNQAESTFLATHFITTIRNGVNSIYRRYSDAYTAKFTERFSDKFIILGVASSWNTHKGIFDFLKLAKMLSDDEIIVLVGNIKNDMSLPDNIINIDRTESIEELVNIYNMASVYVSLSTEETFGLTIAEALSCGVPSVVYRATACSEMVVEGENGYIAQPHNIQQVYEYIQQIKKNVVNDRIDISEKAKRQYSIQHMIDEYLSLYREVLN
jgi:glycosyltransferase involved in cell wall biosynthesis